MNMKYRIGHGFDVHAFVSGDHLTLGGVRVAHNRGVLAHSDGDVVIHALCDALLGALCLGDIGVHFPPSDMKWRNAASQIFLRHTIGLLQEHGYRLGNADITVMAELPKIVPYRELMRQTLSEIIGCTIDRISVKATTTEKLGFIGREEGIAAEAVVLIESQPP